MIFLILLVLFCYVLHKMCSEKGISPMKYLIGFVAGFFLILFATSFAIVLVYGQNVVNDPELIQKAMMFAPFALLFHFLLFIFFRRKISRASADENDYYDDNEQRPIPVPAKGKKDLSYFR